MPPAEGGDDAGQGGQRGGQPGLSKQREITGVLSIYESNDKE